MKWCLSKKWGVRVLFGKKATSSICSHPWLVTLSQALSLVAVSWAEAPTFLLWGAMRLWGVLPLHWLYWDPPTKLGVSPCTAPTCVPNRCQWMDIMQGTEDEGTWTRPGLALGCGMKNCLSLQLFMTGFSSLRLQPLPTVCHLLLSLRRLPGNDQPHAQIPVAFMPREWFSLMVTAFQQWKYNK